MTTAKPRTFRYPKFKTIAFHAHRWLGLTIGSLLCVAGLTGSVLVFWHEIDAWAIAWQFGRVSPVGEPVPIAAIFPTVKAAYAGKGLVFNYLSAPIFADQPYSLFLKDSADRHWEVFVNPYTGQIMGDRFYETSWIGIIYKLHYNLLAGDIGSLVVGIVALLTLILSLTGIVLWPGWRKLATGFKIKWDGHIKRVNFDLHKVAGIIAAIFLAGIGFTGFAWNIPQAQVETGIYAITLTSKPVEPVSIPIPGRSELPIGDLIQRADAAAPNAKTTYIGFGNKPEDPFLVGKKFGSEGGDRFGSTRVYLDRFTGKVTQFHDGTKPSRAEAILNQFRPVHFGNFGGVPTRILYVLVGLAPTFLFITGFVMWSHRRILTGSA